MVIVNSFLSTASVPLFLTDLASRMRDHPFYRYRGSACLRLGVSPSIACSSSPYFGSKAFDVSRVPISLLRLTFV